MPADLSTAQDKASARAAPRSTSTLKQSAHPERYHHATAFHAAEHRIAQGKAKRVLRPAAHQPQATLAADLHTPADQSTAQGKSSARAAPRSTSTSKPSTHPVLCQPLRHVMPAEHRIAQGKATSARAAPRRSSTSSYAGGGSPHAS